MSASDVFLSRREVIQAGATGLPLCCGWCGRRVVVVLPVPVNELSVLADAFLQLHKNCGNEQTA
jgi:hypothetical protein